MDKAALVRIYDDMDEIAGVGVYVGAGQVLTCAHVVTAALETLSGAAPGPEAALRLDFPLVAPLSPRSARVVARHPAADLAMMALASPPPPGANSCSLVQAPDLWDHTFRVFGFPEDHDDGVWASGRLLDRTTKGWVQVEEVKQTGYFVTPGFSGAPVWDEALGGVVGLLVAAESDRGVRAAFMIPAAQIARYYPALVATPPAAASPTSGRAKNRRPGGIRAGSLKATNVVVGVQAPAGTHIDPDLVDATQGGSIEADEMEAEHAVHGVQLVPGSPTADDPTSFPSAHFRSRLQRLSDTEIDALCQDHFWEVYDTFGRGQGRVEKINILLEQCRRKPELAARLAAVLRNG
jgi:hypothetical protein